MYSMVVIEINNSFSKISNLDSITFNKLRKELSYSIDSKAAYFSGRGYNSLRYCIDMKGMFATGLLHRVYAFCIEKEVKFEVKDIRVRPTKMVDHKPKKSHIEPYAFQLEATTTAADMGRGIISATTGSGKSLIIALIIGRLSLKTLVVVPSLQIKEQLTASLIERFGDMSNITVENIDSNALKTNRGWDLLIIDECHHAAAKTYQKLNKGVWNDVYYRLFLTATPFRNQTEETLLFEGIAGQVIYQLTYKQAVEQNLVVPIEAYYIEVPKQKTEAYTWAQVYSELVVNNEIRNEMIAKTLLTLSVNNVSTLCLVKEIAHGNLLVKLTGLPFANGQDDTTRRYITEFSENHIRALIGTNGVLSEGVDTKSCEYVIVCGLGKAKSAFMQLVGRTLRKYPGKTSGKVILIKDKSHKFLSRHFNEQCAILKSEYGVIPVKLEV
jgi:superfamily II DNA or RNA helicase